MRRRCLVDLSGDNRLILLGDYIHDGPDSFGVLKRIMQLERQYGTEKVMVPAGNHEGMAMEGSRPVSSLDSTIFTLTERAAIT